MLLTISGMAAVVPTVSATNYTATKNVYNAVFTGTAGDIFTASAGNGVNVGNSGTATLTGVRVEFNRADSAGSIGVSVINGGGNKLVMRDSDIVLTGSGGSTMVSGVYSNAPTWANPPNEVSLTNVNISLTNLDATGVAGYGVAMQRNTVATISGGTVSITGNNYSGLGSHAGGKVTVHDWTLIMTGTRDRGLHTGGGSTTGGEIIVRNSSVAMSVESGIAIMVSQNGKVDIDSSPVSISGSGAIGYRVEEGGVLVADRPSLIVKGENSIGIQLSLNENWNMPMINISGGVIDSEGDAIGVIGSIVSGTGVINITDGATISGGLLLDNKSTSGDFVVNIDNSDVGNAGGIVVSNSATGNTTVNLSGGSGIIGDVTNNGSGTLTVNLNNSSLTGDIANLGDGTLTIILDDDATGSGGFNGGDLIVGGNSEWNFDKDSQVTNSENHGALNLGDYKVIFDNLTHSGTLNLHVNSDTGAGGSIAVTGTADGAGTVHIDTTGNGKADPNQVLPGKVTGDGTENWQWDPIDWGIDTIIKDGDHFIKSGVSPAGAVLNSSVAIQQAMWFAQQNSLLKRMGKLRYGARASRPLADKDVRVPYNSLIDNIWLRSYGQQLNVGGKVAGRAYEQLIYGIDLGTDHKFTISADSDLYLGVYAGYGRSDIDYRTPGADGEINSYYGGLYATWLHSSGFYIDATIKAASVNNDLKAPYGTTQLTASYSDVNLGGSLEIGKKFTFKDNWFIEPQFQMNYLHILAEDYTAGPMTITASDLDALQLRIGSLFGRSIKLTNSGALQPYIKVSGVETISSGGTLHNGYQHTRANTDGARAELGDGLIWQLDANNQLHLDYEASFGDKYDKPWGLTAGYRHQF
ncbi:MAG: autotransporter outer membrane beta-barrel domain-containing protein [Verrucomicrobiales bacterium]|nr:autotransporter outer membrane beta-barrel domain-containing protein [Verrucomicrobiales bacterium]